MNEPREPNEISADVLNDISKTLGETFRLLNNDLAIIIEQLSGQKVGGKENGSLDFIFRGKINYDPLLAQQYVDITELLLNEYARSMEQLVRERGPQDKEVLAMQKNLAEFRIYFELNKKDLEGWAAIQDRILKDSEKE